MIVRKAGRKQTEEQKSSLNRAGHNFPEVTEYTSNHESHFVKLLIQQSEIGGKKKTAATTRQLEQGRSILPK